jgi:hypothetical protein
MPCKCPVQEVTVVLRLPIACVHKRLKVKVKEQAVKVAQTKARICDDCRAKMAAQDDGWQIDMETEQPRNCL